MHLSKRKELFITLTIVILSFLIRVIRLDIPHEWSFDEVYHALSAEAYALNDPRGYEWWNASPKDLSYEWLHPPIGKLAMALSIKLLAKPYIPESKSAPVSGATTFAWRFPGTIFAALTVWLLIIFGKKLFNNFWIGAVAGGLYAVDGLSFVQSRTGMNDIYITFFVVLVFYRLFIFFKEYDSSRHPEAKPKPACRQAGIFYNLKKILRGVYTERCECAQNDNKKTLSNLLWLGIATGLAASTKWTGFYAVAIVFVWVELFLIKKRNWEKFILGGLILGLVPIGVYILSYGQWWLQGHTWKQFYELHQQIWWYQTGLKATHDYQSGALTWPFLVRPVWFYVKYQDVVKNGVKELYIGNIYTMGNPLIWWAGLVSMLYILIQALRLVILRASTPMIIGGQVEKLSKLSSHPDVRRDSNNNLLPLSIILVGYWGMFIPWVLSPRIMFLYHYLPSVPFLCLGLAYGLAKIREIGGRRGIGRYLVTGYLILVAVAFIYFYPQWSALPLPTKWVDQYYWFKSWK